MDKKYNHQAAEQALQKEWEQNKVYSHENNPGDPYSIDTPPPTVSGSLHIGHVFSYTQTDILARHKRMDGYSVFYPFGFDNNGLPTERFVEKAEKTSAFKIGRSAFIKLCLEKTVEAEKQFKELWQHIGLSVDWDYWYSTISEDARRISQLSFLKLYKDGFVYRKDEPALYCTTCRTTVAQAELDDKDESSFFNNVIFKDKEDNNLIVGTTRPELLYSTGALLYNPADKRYQHLKGQKAFVPIYNTEIPIYEDELVSIEKGTGLVMVSTFGDQTDIIWYKKHNLPLRLSIGLDGKWIPETGVLAGLKVKDARARIIEELKEQNLLVDQKQISHSVNVHERCKREIEYTVLTQWFIDILKNKQTFIELADQIKWYPTFMKSRYINWVENIKWDWCISRQRFYGIPFPVWHCTECQELLFADEKDLPIDPQETSYPGKTCSKCGSEKIVPDTDVMDTWNTSSLSPYICYNLLKKPRDPFTKEAMEFLPMGMRPHAHDIIRTWTFYTIVKAWMHNKTIPWTEVVISGHVLSNEKEKISKSRANNPLAPENLLARYPADAIRYWTASGSLGHDVSFSEAQLKVGQRLITKLWNAFRFAHPHLENFDPRETPKKLGVVNEWLLDTISRSFEKYQTYFEQHEFSLALDTVEKFFWADFCDNYLELIKNQLFNPQEYEADAVYATKWTLYQVGLRILQLYAPYMPYITESIYQLQYQKQIGVPSIHQTKFRKIQKSYSFESAQTIMPHIIAIITNVRKLKTEHQLSLKTPLSNLVIAGSPDMLDTIKPHEQLIKGITQAEKISYSDKEVDTQKLEGSAENWSAHVGLGSKE
ncbi:valine--tRNA ligase [Candidatus Dependentiae bacterium]|nr:MAG: valine--tRNA ligase [Candidatus Dependentiae bacterium]